MSFTTRTVWLLFGSAATALVLPWWFATLLMVFVISAAGGDALAVRRPPRIQRDAPSILSRGVPASISLDTPDRQTTVHLKQPVADADTEVVPSVATDRLDAMIVAHRRGRHLLPAAATISEGPLGLGRWYHRAGDATEITVYPDLPAARRLAMQVRQGRFRDEGRRSRGPIGLGTDLESIREYLPDDDIRQVNWKATIRAGTPMSNTYRVEQERQVVCLLDCGRLMAAPVPGPDGKTMVTRLDVAIDVTAAIIAVAREMGDHVGVIAFSDRVIREVRPRRDGEDAVLGAIHDLEPVGVDAHYELGFHRAAALKRSLVMVFTDLLDDAAGDPLVRALPVLNRKHSVTIVSLADPAVSHRLATPAESIDEAMETAVALEMDLPRRALVSRLRHGGADVVEGSVNDLAHRAVASYLRAKRQARV